MKCNKCGGRMIPDVTALVDALGCVDCGRLVPLTAHTAAKGTKAELNRAMRAARRTRMGRIGYDQHVS